MPEPITTIGVGAIAAYLGKDGIEKLLGPTAEYLGNGLRDFTQRRMETVGRIFQSAQAKLGTKVEAPGSVSPRVLKAVMNDGSYATDNIAVEYFGGVLASSRSETGRDDRGARIARLLDGLSTYQVRTHYLIYASIRATFRTRVCRFGLSENRSDMQIFLPYSGYLPAMAFNPEELGNPQLLSHTFHGLHSDDLIEGSWRFGNKESLVGMFSDAPEAGIICQPSALGSELFLWAFGQGDKPLEYMFNEAFDCNIPDVPQNVAGALATKPENA
jgi:hypothetical protein